MKSELWQTRVPVLSHITYGHTRRSLDFYLQKQECMLNGAIAIPPRVNGFWKTLLLSSHLIWKLHTDLLETAGKAAATASQGSLQSHDLLAQIVQDPQGERSSCFTAVPSAAVSIFHS